MNLHPDLLARTNSHFSHSTSDILEALPQAFRRELNSLSSETDSELRDEALLSLARRLDQRGRPDLAAAICLPLAETSGPVQARARSEWELLQGRGELGRQAERWLRDFSVQVTDPAALLAMGTAGAAFRTVRLATLARLQMGPWRGTLAPWLASCAALGVEAPTFTLAGRGASELLGRHLDWSGEALGRDLAASYLTLTGLRGAGALGRATLRSFPVRISASPALHFAVGQGSLLGGILLAHSLETSVGLRPESTSSQVLVESLATLLHFQVAGRLSRAAFGRNFRTWEQGLDLQTELLNRPRFRGPGSGPFSLEPVLAGFPVSASNAESNRKLDSHIVKMSGGREGGDPRPVHLETSPNRAPSALGSSPIAALLEGMNSHETGLRAYLDTLPVAATVSQLQGTEGELRVIATNPEFLRLLGQTEIRMAQRPLTEFLSLDGRPISASQIWTMVRGGVFKATAMEFESRPQPQKVWVSGLVRTIYGKDFAFTFYSPRSEPRNEPPTIPAELKALQLADGMRSLDIDREGYFELRSTLELSLQVSNPESPLIRELRRRDLQLRILNYETAPIAELGPTFAAVFSHHEKNLPFPPTRSLFIEQMWRQDAPERALHLKVGHFGFAPTKDSTPPVFPPAATKKPAEPIVPTSTRFEPGSLRESVRRTLEGILAPKTPERENVGSTKKPPRE